MRATSLGNSTVIYPVVVVEKQGVSVARYWTLVLEVHTLQRH